MEQDGGGKPKPRHGQNLNTQGKNGRQAEPGSVLESASFCDVFAGLAFQQVVRRRALVILDEKQHFFKISAFHVVNFNDFSIHTSYHNFASRLGIYGIILLFRLPNIHRKTAFSVSKTDITKRITRKTDPVEKPVEKVEKWSQKRLKHEIPGDLPNITSIFLHPT